MSSKSVFFLVAILKDSNTQAPFMYFWKKQHAIDFLREIGFDMEVDVIEYPNAEVVRGSFITYKGQSIGEALYEGGA